MRDDRDTMKELICVSAKLGKRSWFSFSGDGRLVCLVVGVFLFTCGAATEGGGMLRGT